MAVDKTLVENVLRYVDEQIAIMEKHGPAPELSARRYAQLVFDVLEATVKASGAKKLSQDDPCPCDIGYPHLVREHNPWRPGDKSTLS